MNDAVDLAATRCGQCALSQIVERCGDWALQCAAPGAGLADRDDDECSEGCERWEVKRL